MSGLLKVPINEGVAMKYQVLVYPNITYARDLEKDSYIVVVREMIRHLNNVRSDLHFIMLLPEHVDSLDMPNVEQVTYSLPTYPNTMRAHFDTRAFLTAINWKYRNIDIVWSHLPEHMLAMKNVLYNATNERPPIVGYCHWWEVPENTGYAETMLWHNLAGMLAMDYCGVNSEWVKQLVLDHANRRLSWQAIMALGEIIQPQYLGTDPTYLSDAYPEPGRIIFNHRPNEYTGFNWACQQFDRLWERRQDFKVGFTMADVDKPWAFRIDAPTRDDYLDELARSWIGVGTFKRYSAWSVSVMDGLGMCLPYVLPRGFCYPEMVGDNYSLLYDPREFMPTLERALNMSMTTRLDMAHTVRTVAESYEWSRRITPYSDMFHRAIASLTHATVTTPTYARVRALALEGKTKNEIMRAMSWTGPRVPFGQYREALRREGIGLTEEYEQLSLV